MRIPPSGGGICGKLIEDFPPGCLQGGGETAKMKKRKHELKREKHGRERGHERSARFDLQGNEFQIETFWQ